MKYICELCGYVYDEARGESARKVPAGTVFTALPQDYTCPGCGSEKEAFDLVKADRNTAAVAGDGADFWHGAKYAGGKLESER